MENRIRLLHMGNFSCVINSQGVIRSFTQRGVADLYDLLKTDVAFLKGALVADKVVGKGAAALVAQGGVRKVYADLISESAYALLVNAGIEVSYGQIVHHIENREKTDWCPLEKSCKGEDRVSEILPIIDIYSKNQRQVIRWGYSNRLKNAMTRCYSQSAEPFVIPSSLVCFMTDLNFSFRPFTSCSENC